MATSTKTTARDRDNYNTTDAIASFCVDKLLELIQHNGDTLFFEPSCGHGSFVKSLCKHGLNVRANDISTLPTDVSIPLTKLDFLEIDLASFECKDVVVVGNPPFGKNASLAVKFFNHAAKSDVTSVIAFVVPRSFQKPSIQNRLNSSFHLHLEEVLPMFSFWDPITKEATDVPCVFQVWKRSFLKREKIQTTKHSPYFVIFQRGKIRHPDEANMGIQRVGQRAGRVFLGRKELTERFDDYIKHGNYHYLRVDDEFASGIENFSLEDAEEGDQAASTHRCIPKEVVYRKLHDFIQKTHSQ